MFLKDLHKIKFSQWDNTLQCVCMAESASPCWHPSWFSTAAVTQWANVSAALWSSSLILFINHTLLFPSWICLLCSCCLTPYIMALVATKVWDDFELEWDPEFDEIHQVGTDQDDKQNKWLCEICKSLFSRILFQWILFPKAILVQDGIVKAQLWYGPVLPAAQTAWCWWPVCRAGSSWGSPRPQTSWSPLGSSLSQC